MSRNLLLGILLMCVHHTVAKELAVAKGGDDANEGSASKPFLTISAAAAVAQPGDTITVHAGVYRERINPPRGGDSDDKRIVYRAAPGETVEIAGSEPVHNWTWVEDDVWKVSLPNAGFGKFNPYNDLIHGDWFDPKGRPHHTGAVYLDGVWLSEAAKLEDVLYPNAGDTGYLLNVASFAPGDGAPVHPPMPADQFASRQGTQTAPCSEGGQCLGFIVGGDWARYEKVNFGERTESMVIRAASGTRGGQIDLRLDAPDGDLLGTCQVGPTGGWQSWVSCRTAIRPTSGLKTLCLVFKTPAEACWWGHVDAVQTTLWARFPGLDPNTHRTEINVRQSVFYPDEPGRNYLTVRGFTLRDAATPWAPPTAEQIGLIGTNWSKGWIIENNTITHSACSGITLGKYGDKDDNTSASSAEGYVETVERALMEGGWGRDRVGGHVVRHNHISQCEQTGVCGSLGGIFSEIIGNEIHDIHVRDLYGGAEMAGIKLHGAIDVLIQGNCIHHTNRALWMDWMAQGTRISRNLCFDNGWQDLYVEVNHGPFLVDNNLFLSRENLFDMSEGGAYAQNLFGGSLRWQLDNTRATPILRPHSTAVARLAKIPDTDNRFYNNLFLRPRSAEAAGYGLGTYDAAKRSLQTGGNVYVGGTQPDVQEQGAATDPGFDPAPRIVPDAAGLHLLLAVDGAMAAAGRPLVTTALLGKTDASQSSYENPDGSPLTVERDYLDRPREAEGTCAGPFSTLQSGSSDLLIWPPMSIQRTDARQ